MKLYNIEDVTSVFRNINKEVLAEVSEKASLLLQKHILDDVYGKLPNKYYEDGTGRPTFQFMNAFVLSDIASVMNTTSKKITYKWETMDSPTKAHPSRHGKYSDTGIMDFREELASMLNVSGMAYSKPRNKFWDNFIMELDKKIGNWFYASYTKRGLKVDKTKLKYNWEIDL